MNSRNGGSPHPPGPKPSADPRDPVNIPVLMVHIAPNARLDHVIGYMRRAADQWGLGVAAVFSGVPFTVWPGQSAEVVAANFDRAVEELEAEQRRHSLILPGGLR